ncbi:MAG TPA: hypothetical protein DCY20_01285 [Firmicutes bacterium]|nr:hypothetical protein [Bacillota bacterium]
MSKDRETTATYVIQPGDTIKIIAEAFHTTPTDLILLNGNKPMVIKADNEITVPLDAPVGYSIYIIKPGEDIVEIATHHGVTLEELRALNGDVLAPGHPIIVPEQLSSQYHVVHPNETVQDLFTRFKLTPEDLVNLNNDIYLKEGQILKVEY